MGTICLNLAISLIVFNYLFCLQQSEYGSSKVDFHRLTVEDI